MVEIIIAIVCIVLGLAEYVFWDVGLLWHKEPKRDPRNFRPPY